jgi:hypothetical protein
MTTKMKINTRAGFGDNVRIRETPETIAAGLSGKNGSVNGETVPSMSGVTVIGTVTDDFALSVMFKGGPVQHAWFAKELVEFIDHAPGATMSVGNVKAVRQADGTWKETKLDGSPLDRETSIKPWWKFW